MNKLDFGPNINAANGGYMSGSSPTPVHRPQDARAQSLDKHFQEIQHSFTGILGENDLLRKRIANLETELDAVYDRMHAYFKDLTGQVMQARDEDRP